MTWLAVETEEALADGLPRRVVVGRNRHGQALEALVLLVDGSPRAYLNRCAHQPLPLDARAETLLDEAQRHLVCSVHGALYRLSDGVCVAGPCPGQALMPLSLRSCEGRVELRVPAAAVLRALA